MSYNLHINKIREMQSTKRAFLKCLTNMIKLICFYKNNMVYF
jgi:hypothetical protein